MIAFYYTINLPGCLPDSDEPPHPYETFEEARNAAVEDAEGYADALARDENDMWVVAAQDVSRLGANESLVLPNNYILSFAMDEVEVEATTGVWPV